MEINLGNVELKLQNGFGLDVSVFADCKRLSSECIWKKRARESYCFVVSIVRSATAVVLVGHAVQLERERNRFCAQAPT